MRIAKFLAALALAAALAVIVNTHQPFGSQLPALGPLFSPFTGFWQNAEPVATDGAWTPSFSALEAPVRVVFDERMVPHIFAENLSDAAFIQGYITARDRLWQMDFISRAAVGRISELIGERALEYDRRQRRKGMLVAAENALKGWSRSSEELALLQAYSDGVNAFTASLRPADYPLEFKLMGYAPEPWEPLKCAIFFKYMAESLCSRNDDIPASNTYELLGAELFEELFPEYNPKQSPVIPESVAWNFEKMPLEHQTAAPEPEMMSELIRHKQLPQPPDGIGSNNWAVAGSKTASGYPILCNDPHLGLRLPAIWYEVQLSVPGINAYGVSLPGIPGIIIGFNENIAWGVTNVGHDVLDWYKVKWADEEKNTYYYGGQTETVGRLVEVIKVRGREKPVLDTVKYTVWGPVVYEDDSLHQDMAMHWLALDVPAPKPFYEIGTFLRLMKGQGYEDYAAALRSYESPAQNFAFAGKSGDIAITVNGNLPLKRSEQGRFVQDGSDPENGWYGFIPRDQIPQVRNPERGFVSSANQNSTGPGYPYYYNGRFDNYRGRYINRRLEEMDSITVEDMMALQLDNYSILAEEGVPILLALLDSANSPLGNHPDVQALRQWDFRFEKDAKAPVLFDRWLKEARRSAFDELYTLEDSVEVIIPEPWLLLSLMGGQPGHAIFDMQGTTIRETAADVVRLALEKVMEEESPQDWSTYKNTQIGHLARIGAFSSGPIDVGGFGDAPNAIKEDHGPSWRMVVALGEPVQAFGVYPGGQSGNPGSPYYQSMIEQWTEGRYNPLFLMKGPGDRSHPVRYMAVFESGNR
ncbi:MAG: penicillin acylase family protein [Phaeodactylibacter sp.]|nr:penicillin acylase family protein [Phaeodactylibacter sp.]MCB9049023.1 penicillin acylase family protein [Lewinellaceae bacterium]